MKLLRYGPPGEEKPGLLASDGTLRDLSSHVADIAGVALSSDGLARLAALDTTTLPKVPGSPRLGPCVSGTRNFVCIGLNYADHAAETGAPVPKEPIIFMKSLNAITGPNDPVEIPRKSRKTDWEVELGVIIGTRAKYVTIDDAMNHVAGYCVVHDVSEREFQLERGGTWDKGKGHETFGPVGPWLVTRDEIPDPKNLRLWLEVNGSLMQNGSTATMIFDVPELVSYVSQFMTLTPGDIISTGTPPGVGMGHKPASFLKIGNKVRLGIDGLGEQNQNIIEARLL